jgi:transposase
MLTEVLFPGIAGVHVDTVVVAAQTLHLYVSTTAATSRCPLCHTASAAVHSRYWRTLADLPCGGRVVTLHLRTRRYFCRVPTCRRRIFTERLPALMAPWARRTQRLDVHLLRDAIDVGGAAGARHATAQGTPISPTTLLRLIHALPLPPVGPVQVLGVDDFARRRGRTYATILVDLEAHRVVDLLPDRAAETLAAWLRQHPQIGILSRDGAEVYAQGARHGAPQALQVMDRFHLLATLRQALADVLQRHRSALRQVAHAASTPDAATKGEEAAVASGGPGPARSVARRSSPREHYRAQRLARYNTVVALRAQGLSRAAIAARTGVSKRTVSRFLAADTFPERKPRRRGPSILDPYKPYLAERWAAGCHTATQLWRDLCACGYNGSYALVYHYVAQLQTGVVNPARPGAGDNGGVRWSERTTAAPSLVHLALLLVRDAEALEDRERAEVAALCQACPEVAQAYALAQHFARMVRARQVDSLDTWLAAAQQGPRELRSFARGITRDKAAVRAALRLPWSQGQVEGQVNRTKLIKRLMFGRGSLDLLRRRVLYSAAPHPQRQHVRRCPTPQRVAA